MVGMVGVVGLLAFPRVARAAQEQVGPWTMITDDSGRIVSMSYPNPPTALHLARMFDFRLGANAEATQGRIEYKDGAKRDMTKEEIYYYYHQLLEGPKAAWDYLAAKNRVTRYFPAARPLPMNIADSFVRVILRNGANFFGALVLESGRQTGFSVAVGSKGPTWFGNESVKEVQVAK
jgi:hypothetical protein